MAADIIGIENIIREAELEEMEKKWREENARIMAQFPTSGNYMEPLSNSPAPEETSIQQQPATAGESAPALPPVEEPTLPLDLPRRDLP